MKKTITIVALALLGAGLVPAQETTGDIIGTIISSDGLGLPGVTVTVTNPETGLERSSVSSPVAEYRFLALPPARYRLTAGLGGFKTVTRSVSVELGRTTTTDIEMQLGAFEDVVEVTGEAPLVDVKSTVSGITVDSDELTARLPISRDVTRVAMLAPATIDADPRFGAQDGGVANTPGQNVPVVAGASLAENSYIVNGLNITSFRQMIGSSYVPMEFVDEVQVKTGGYEAEFGRATGGVINLVTKSGTNTLRGGVSLYWNPEDLQENEPDTFQRDSDGNLHLRHANSNEERSSLEANASLGGPLVSDRLFFFAFVRYSDWSRLDMEESNLARRGEAADPYWGGKLDWNITSSHRLEGTFISDWTEIDESFFDVDPETGVVGDLTETGYSQRGGDSWVLKYSGIFRDNLLLSAQGGVNPFERTSRSSADDVCPNAYDTRTDIWEPLGCWVNWYPGTDSDERAAYRIDLDWLIGRHSLRAGVDAETNTSFSDSQYSGGVYYRYYVNGTEGEPYWFDHLPWDQELVRVQHYSVSDSYDVISNAAYVQDSWSITPSLTLNLGLRWERFESENPLGQTFMEVNDQVAPRIGAIWDVAGDGTSKVYASFGVYHLPMSTHPAIFFAGGEYFDEGWYPLVGGINPDDGSPEDLGDELDYDVFLDGAVPDSREALDSDFDPMSQSELILGYERLIGDTWSVGVRGVARRFNEVIEDITIAKALWEVYGVERLGPDELGDYSLFGTYRLTNPGSDFSGWYDLDGDGELDPIYLTAEQLGYPEAERTYYAVELTARRRYADRWMVQGSYTWSHLYGNYSGLANADYGPENPWRYMGRTFDVAALMDHASGDLPNDRRHNLKLFGTYAFDLGLQLSANAWYRSGRPVNGFGVHPTDPWAQLYYDSAFYNNGEPCPRGCGGRTDSVWALDLGVKYDWQWLGADWNVRVDAFNVTNNDSVELVDEFADNWTGGPNPSYLMPWHHQTPRRVRLGFGVSF